MRDDNDYDVIINGGGPVGVGLAIELAQRGHSVAVIERHPEPQPVPKGQNLTQRTMESIRRWGCEEALRGARTIPAGKGIGGLTCYGTLLSDYHYDWLQRELVRPYYATDNERLPQYATERVLRARAAELPGIRTFHGWAGVSFAEDDDGVRVTMQEHRGDATEELRGRYLVGCDGSNSTVRAAAGITETRRDHDKKMVLLVFRSTELHALLERYPGKAFYNVLHPDLKGYWMFFGRVDLGSTWFFHAPVPLETTKDNFDFAGYLHSAVGAEFAVEFEYVGFWDLRIAVADDYRKGRVFIAGDAAHSHPPYGGYGINTGFEDARNLGWKLAAELAGWAGPDLLDSYDAERRPVFESTARDFIEAFIEQDRDFLDTYHPERDRAAFEAAWAARAEGAPEVNSFEPNYLGSPVVPGSAAGRPSAHGGHSFAARAGHHLAPQPLSDGREMFDAMGPGFTLLALDAPEEHVRAFEDAAMATGVTLTVLRDSAGEGREALGAPLVLVRPDEFVVWAGEAPGDAGAILKAAIGH